MAGGLFQFWPVLFKHMFWTFKGGGLFSYMTLGESPVVAGGLFQLWPLLLKYVFWTLRPGDTFPKVVSVVLVTRAGRHISYSS